MTALDGGRTELEREQAHIDRAYAALDRLREGAAGAEPAPVPDDEGAGGTYQDRFERERLVADARRRVGELRWGDPPLVFGRLDLDDPVGDLGTRFHVGRIGVFDERHDQLVVDWRAPVAAGFYRATRAEPLGVRRRRSFRCRGRRLLGIDDVVLGEDAGEGELHGEAALLAALEAPRTGRLTDVVATVQAEQDEVIRAPMAGITIVQGGAGTGKTVVALHRAAYLLYTYRDVLDRQGVLLLGPNPRFLDHVRDVLPSLGEHDARLATVHELFPGVRPVPDADLDVATVKADIRMARVVRRAVRTRQRHVREAVRVPVGRFLLKLPADVVNHVVDAVRRVEGTHNERRRLVEADLVAALYAELQRRNTAAVDRMRDPGLAGLAERLRRTDAFQELLERIWPLLRPQELLHDLFGSPALLRHAGRGGLLDDAELGLLHRPRSEGWRDVTWTHADVPLLHEAHALLGPLPRPPAPSTEPTEDEQLIVDRVVEHVEAAMTGIQQGLDPVMEADLRRSVLDEVRVDTGTAPPDERPPDVPQVWGTVLVDEAQDLSPMAWRMVARTCPNQAMTIVGDLAQGTAPWSPSSWDDVVRWIGPRHPARRHELHVNYRTPTEITAWADPLSAAPGRARAVRSTGHEPEAVAVGPDDLGAAAGRQARALVERRPEGTVAVVCAASRAAEVRPHLDEGIELHAPDTVKGLEFDGVVVVEPAELVGGPAGTAPLYIAMTRATTHLTLVHASPLPAPLPPR
ncbi:MAG: HelD family protein [Acidimicrobiia bacterium]